MATGLKEMQVHDFLTCVDLRLQFSSLFDPKETADEMKTCVAKAIYVTL